MSQIINIIPLSIYTATCDKHDENFHSPNKKLYRLLRGVLSRNLDNFRTPKKKKTKTQLN